MKILCATLAWFLSATTALSLDDEFLDRLEQTLTFSAFDAAFRFRLSGTVDLETYHFTRPTPALIEADGHFVFNPRLILFADAQLAARIYFFAQARFDRGFDPSEGAAEARLDEFAFRITPWGDGRFNLQIGRFTAVVGNWMERHLSWENPFINAPLVYENLTAIWDSAGADSIDTLLGWAHVELADGTFSGDADADKRLRNPIIWGPSYASGASISGRIGKIEYAAEIKHASLSSRPEAWELREISFQHPTFSGRLGLRPNQAWNFGVSASTGSYLRKEAEPPIAEGHDLGDYRQTVLGQDISFAWRHLQIWAECYQARFEIPSVGDVETVSYYVEAKYKLTPQLFGALRWNQQFFSKIGEEDRPWGRDVWRVDGALGYRFTAHTQLKLQYSVRHEQSAPTNYGHMVAAQFTLRF